MCKVTGRITLYQDKFGNVTDHITVFVFLQGKVTAHITLYFKTNIIVDCVKWSILSTFQVKFGEDVLVHVTFF